jgi:hypothetical protein
LGSCAAQAKVIPPNYDFSIKKFTLFMPGKLQVDIEKKYKTKELMFKSEQFQTYKYYIEHIRYRFPILVQYYKGVVTDFHARLPQYFLHDIFHQSLINKLGAQDIYKNSEEQSIYIWKNKNNQRHYYSGGCAITCFPIFYAVKNIDQQLPQEYTSLIQQLKLTKTTLEQKKK